MFILPHAYQELPVNPLVNGTASSSSAFATQATRSQAGASSAAGAWFEPPWQPHRKPSPGGHGNGNGNGWRGIHTERHHLSRNAIVARIRTRVEWSLLPGPALSDARPAPVRAASLGQAMLDGMRSLIASLPTLRVGPPGADAAPAVSTAQRPTADRVSYFIKSFEKAFDIRKTPAVSGNADLAGVTVVIGADGHESESAARALTHLRRDHGDRLLMEGASRAYRWTGPTCDRFDAALKASCVPIESGCAASTRYYDTLMAYQTAVHEACAFILGNLSVLRPDIKVELPRDIDQCLAFSARYADLVATMHPESMQDHVMHVAEALTRFKKADRQTRAARQAHMLEQIRQPIGTGAARFVIMHSDFLADLAPQLLSDGKIILMMPAATASDNARYRMPHLAHQSERNEL